MIRRILTVALVLGLLVAAVVLSTPAGTLDVATATTRAIPPGRVVPPPAVLVDAAWETPAQQVASVNLVSALHNVLGTGWVIAFSGDAVTGPVALTVTQVPGDSRVVVTPDQVLVGDQPAALVALTSDAGRAALAERLQTRFVRPREDADLRRGIDVLTNGTVTLAEMGGWPSALHLEGTVWDPEGWEVYRSVYGGDERLRVFFNGFQIPPMVTFWGVTTPVQDAWPVPVTLAGIVNQVARDQGHVSRSFMAPALGPAVATRLAGAGGGLLRGYLPETMAYLSGPGQAVLTTASPAEAQATALLLGAISAMRYEPLRVAMDAPRPAWSVAWGTAALDVPRLPLVPGEPVTLEDVRARTTLIPGQVPPPAAAIQYVPGPRPQLVFQDVAGDGRALLELAREAAAPDRFTALSGNVLVESASGNALAIDQFNRAVVIVQAAPPGLVDLEAWRWVLIPVLGLAVIVLWVVIYRRVGRPSPIPPEPSGAVEL